MLSGPKRRLGEPGRFAKNCTEIDSRDKSLEPLALAAFPRLGPCPKFCREGREFAPRPAVCEELEFEAMVSARFFSVLAKSEPPFFAKRRSRDGRRLVCGPANLAIIALVCFTYEKQGGNEWATKTRKQGSLCETPSGKNRSRVSRDLQNTPSHLAFTSR
jgi:hypothetical protein